MYRRENMVARIWLKNKNKKIGRKKLKKKKNGMGRRKLVSECAFAQYIHVRNISMFWKSYAYSGMLEID